MQLFKVPDRSWVKVLKQEQPPPGGHGVEEGETVFFHHIDGMYSLCTHKTKGIVHLKAWTEVEIVESD